MSLLQIEDLRVAFSAGRTVQAIDGVSLSLDRGEVLALIGESGSGKSVTLRTVMRLNPGRTRVTGGIRFEGRDVLAMGQRELRAFRGGDARTTLRVRRGGQALALPVQVPLVALVTRRVEIDANATAKGRRIRESLLKGR